MAVGLWVWHCGEWYYGGFACIVISEKIYLNKVFCIFAFQKAFLLNFDFYIKIP